MNIVIRIPVAVISFFIEHTEFFALLAAVLLFALFMAAASGK